MNTGTRGELGRRRRRRVAGLGAAVWGLSLVLAGCSETSESAAEASDEFVPGRPAPSLPPSRSEPVEVAFGTEIWRTPLGVATDDGYRVEGSAEQFVVPVIDAATGGFTAFVGDATTGTLATTLPLPDTLGWPITMQPSDQPLVLTVEPIPAGDGQQVVARRVDGTTEWTSPGANLGQAPGSNLTVERASADRVLVRAQPQSPAQRGDAPMWVLEAADGQVAWSVAPPSTPRWTELGHNLIMYDSASDGSAASPSDTTVVRSITDGAQLASFALDHSDPRYGGLCGGIIAANRIIACGLDAAGVGTAVLAEPSGRIIAEYDIAGRPVIDTGAQVVAMPTTDGEIVAVDAETGEQLWALSAEQVEAGQNLRIKEGRDGLFVADAGPLNVVFDALTGDVLLADTFFYLRPAAILDGQVLSARDGDLVAFEGVGIPVGSTLDDAEQIIFINP